MDTGETENKDKDEGNGYFQKFKESFKVHLTPLWEDTKENLHSAKFLVEVLGLVGLAAYVVIAAGQRGATLQVMRADQRAWITPGIGQIHIEVKKQIGQMLILQNTGRTPAKKFHAVFYLRPNDGTVLDFDYSRPNPAEANGNAIFPSPQPLVLEIPLFREGTEGRIIADDELRNNYLAGRIFFVAYGKITYDDIFGTSHWITQCNYSISPDIVSGLTRKAPAAAQKCADYNNVDEN